MSGNQSVSAGLGASQGTRSRHPINIEQQLRSMDTYRELVTGQRDKESEKDKGMARYLGDWEKNWKSISGDISKGK